MATIMVIARAMVNKAGASAAEAVARNPGAAATIQTLMVLGLAFIESLALFTLVIIFLKA